MFSAQLYEEQCDKVESLTQDYEDRIVDLSERLEHSESLIQAAQQECEQRDEQIQSLNHTVQQVDQSRIIFGMLVVAAHPRAIMECSKVFFPNPLVNSIQRMACKH